jgi:membrane-associated HD superfamily phosphohydrolase
MKSISINFLLSPTFLITAMAAAFLALLFSFSNEFPYKYSQNAPWLYDDLYAEQDIPLAFSHSENDSILQVVEQNYAPVFVMDKEVLSQKKELFAADFKRQLNLAGKDNAFPDVNKSPKIYLQFGEKLLSKIYEQGIFPDDVNLEGKKEVIIVRIEAKKQLISKVFTKKTAFDALTDSLPASELREPEFLLSVLEDKIVPNLVYDENQSKQSKTNVFQTFLEKRDTLKKGTLIIARGANISTEIFNQLEAYKTHILGDKKTNAFSTRFALFAVLNCFLLLFLLAFYAQNESNAYNNKRFLIYLLIITLAIQLLHFICQKQEIHPLLTPILVIPMLLKQRISAFSNLFTFVIMVFIASQISTIPYIFTLTFISSGAFYIFAEKPFSNFKNGQYLHLSASIIIGIFVFLITSLQQHQSVDLLRITLMFFFQLLILVATPFLMSRKKIIQ